jgi:hypothetical protein
MVNGRCEKNVPWLSRDASADLECRLIRALSIWDGVKTTFGEGVAAGEAAQSEP